MNRYEGPAWRDALTIPLGLLVCTAIAGFFADASRSESDWLGGAMLVTLLGGALLASIVALVFSVASFRRKERLRYVSLVSSVPGGIFLLQLVATIGHEIFKHHS